MCPVTSMRRRWMALPPICRMNKRTMNHLTTRLLPSGLSHIMSTTFSYTTENAAYSNASVTYSTTPARPPQHAPHTPPHATSETNQRLPTARRTHPARRRSRIL